MFKRSLLGFGRIRSNEGFTVRYGHKSVYYTDERGEFQIGFEDELLFPASLCLLKPFREIAEDDRALILDRVLQALKWDGHDARVWASDR